MRPRSSFLLGEGKKGGEDFLSFDCFLAILTLYRFNKGISSYIVVIANKRDFVNNRSSTVGRIIQEHTQSVLSDCFSVVGKASCHCNPLRDRHQLFKVVESARHTSFSQV